MGQIVIHALFTVLVVKILHFVLNAWVDIICNQHIVQTAQSIAYLAVIQPIVYHAL